MQMAAWLEANGLSISEVAKGWGIHPVVLQRPVRGLRWPSAFILVRCLNISNGQVALADWIETCRPLLIAEKIIIEGTTNGEAEESSDAAEAGTGGRGRRRKEKSEPDTGA